MEFIRTTRARAVAAVCALHVVTACRPDGATEPPISPASPNSALDVAPQVGAHLSSRLAYAWANQPSTSSYVPHIQYRFNKTGGGITIRRLGQGTYSVSFAQLAKGRVGSRKETVIVTPYGNAAVRCFVERWFDAMTSLVVNVRCADTAGALVDSRFTVLLVGENSLEKRQSFLLANQATTANYVPHFSYRFRKPDNGQQHTIQRAGTGDYIVDMQAPRLATDGPESYFTSAFGSVDTECRPTMWGSMTTARVQCFDRTGAPVDSRFTALLVEQGQPSKRFSFAYADHIDTPSYNPDRLYSFNSFGGAIQIARTAVGTYSVTFDGLQKGRGQTETVVLHAFGAIYSHCAILNWTSVPSGLRVDLECRDAAGALMDSPYTIMVLE